MESKHTAVIVPFIKSNSKDEFPPAGTVTSFTSPFPLATSALTQISSFAGTVKCC